MVEKQLALVPALDERAGGKRGRCSRRADDDCVRLCGDELQHLTGDARILRRVALARDQRNLARLRRLVDLGEKGFTQRVVEADVAERLHAGRRGVLEDRAGHHHVGLRGLERPRLFRVHGLDDADRRGERDHRRLAVGEHIDHRQRVGRGGRADDRIDLVLADQLFCVLHRGRRIGGVVEQDVLDALSRDSLRAQRNRVLFGNAEGSGRPGRGHRHPDPHLRMRGRRESERNRGKQAPEDSVAHDFSSPLSRGRIITELGIVPSRLGRIETLVISKEGFSLYCCGSRSVGPCSVPILSELDQPAVSCRPISDIESALG